MVPASCSPSWTPAARTPAARSRATGCNPCALALANPALALTLALALAPVAGRAQVPPVADALTASLDKLRDRAEFIRSTFPSATLPAQYDATSLAAISAQISATPQTAAEQLKVLSARLDRLALPLVKRKIYEVGTTVKTTPTDRGNVESRRTLLVEFAQILKRQGISVLAYYPKGETSFVPAIRLQSEEVYPIIDEHLWTVAARLKSEMESSAGGGGGGGGGGTSGYDATGGGGDGGGAGGMDSSDFPPPSGAGGEHHHASTLPPPTDEWTVLRVVLLVALALLAVGSMAALILPRWRSLASSAVGRLAKGKPATPPLHEDQVKRALAVLHRGEYRKALGVLEKIEGCGRADVAFYLAFCYVRLMDRDKAPSALARLPLDRLEQDEILRLANACEEAKLFSDSIRLLEWLHGREPENRTLTAKLDLVRSEAAKEDKKA